MKVAIIIPNWNGADMIAQCLGSLTSQSYHHDIVVVDNGSVDDSVEIIRRDFPMVHIIENSKNLGFAGGVNTGIRYAMKAGYEAVGLLNNDAIADKSWLDHLVKVLVKDNSIGMVTGKLLSRDGEHIDSTGDIYTTWGIPFPRGRGEQNSSKYDKLNWVFGVSGGASLYRVSMLDEIGLFDEDFFAYYEDVDLSFRAQLSGWKAYFEPRAIAYHSTSATGSKIKGFFTYQTIKNYPFLFWKNVPFGLMPIILPRFLLAYGLFTAKGLITPSRTLFTIKGLVVSAVFLPKKLFQRYRIMKNKSVSNEYIRSMLTWDLPPNANALRRLRTKWHKLRGRI